MPYILKAEELESRANKVTVLDNSVTDDQYPSAKAVKDALDNLDIGDSSTNSGAVGSKYILNNGKIGDYEYTQWSDGTIDFYFSGNLTAEWYSNQTEKPYTGRGVLQTPTDDTIYEGGRQYGILNDIKYEITSGYGSINNSSVLGTVDDIGIIWAEVHLFSFYDVSNITTLKGSFYLKGTWSNN